MAKFTSQFAIGDKVRVNGYGGNAIVVGVRFLRIKILYDVDRELGGSTIRDVDSGDVGPA